MVSITGPLASVMARLHLQLVLLLAACGATIAHEISSDLTAQVKSDKRAPLPAHFPDAVHAPLNLPAEINSDKIAAKPEHLPDSLHAAMPVLIKTDKRPPVTDHSLDTAHSPITLPALIKPDKRGPETPDLGFVHAPINVPIQVPNIHNTPENLQVAPAIHPPMTLPALIKSNQKSVVSDLDIFPVPINVVPHNIQNSPVATVPAIYHTPMTLPAQVVPSNKVLLPEHFADALHKPITLPAQIVPVNKADAPVATAPAIHTPQTLPAQIHTPMTLPAQITSDKRRPQVALAPAIHTPMTLPAHNVDPAIHTPQTLPAQLSTDKKGPQVAAAPAIHTPQTLPAHNVAAVPAIHTPQTLPAHNVAAVPAIHTPQTLPAQIHTPMTLPAQITSDKRGPQVAVAPAIYHTPMTLPAQITAHNVAVAPAIHTPQTLPAQIHTPMTLPAQIHSPVYSQNVAPAIRPAVLPEQLYTPGVIYAHALEHHADITAIHTPMTLPALSSQVKKGPVRIEGVTRDKRQYVGVMTLPARLPPGGFNNNYNFGGRYQGGYQGIQPLPAVVNRPAGGHLRGQRPVYPGGRF